MLSISAIPCSIGISRRGIWTPARGDNQERAVSISIVSTGLDDLSVQTRGPKDTADHLCIKGESVRGDQRDTFEIRPAGDIPEEGECVSIASSSRDGRRPEPRPDLDRGEDPDGLFLVVEDRTNLICLKFCDGDSMDLSIVETATSAGSFF
jgi:hypothetical protein